MTANTTKKPSSTKAAKPGDALAAFSQAIADKMRLVPTTALMANPRRSRTHDEAQISLIMGSFLEFGLLNPIIADEDNVILAGHARHEAAKRLGIAELPVVRVEHLSDDQKRAYVIADNKIATKAGWDIEVLAFELEYLTEVEFDTDLTGFSIGEMDVLVDDAKIKKKDDADNLPDPVLGPATSILGDLWLLGEHRLICGSALDAATLSKLMDGQFARMVCSDPPFNVAISGHVSGLGKVKHREFAMASGEMTRDQFTAFLTSAFDQMNQHLVDGGLVYTFIDWRNQFSMMLAAENVGWTQHNLAVWDKMTGAMGSHYRSQHELCWIFKKGKSPHLNNVELGKHGRYRTNVWQHPGMSSFGRGRDAALAMHPTVKPVNLLVEAIKDCTRRGDIILDPFLGSGSTLIAAQKSGRVGYGVELDPLYVDTIVRRYELLTGKPAIHVETGETFATVAEARREDEEVPIIEADTTVTVAPEVDTNSDMRVVSSATVTAAPIRVRSRPRPGSTTPLGTISRP